MGWTIVQPSPSHIEARKVVSSGYDVSNFAFSQVNTADEQPLQNEELLSLPALYALLKEVDRDEDNCFLMRGKPVGQNEDLSYGLTDSHWIDCSSKQFQLDLDNETDLLNQDASLDERVAVALEELPFLNNCRFIAQLSSSAGLGIVKKGVKEEDKSKKYCLRLWVETDKGYSCAELHHHLEPFSSVIDLSMYEPTRRHYIMRGHCVETYNALKDEPHLKYYDGEALSLQEISGNIKEIARKKTKDSSLKAHKPQKKTGKAWQTLYSTNRKDLVLELEKDAKNGELYGIRNELFSELFRREALFNSGDCALLIDEMLNSPALMGDRDEKNLQDWAKLSGKKALSILKQDAEAFRNSHYSSIHNFHEIDLQKRDWSNLLDHRAIAIRSCMGTNKTKGVIYDLVKKAKAEGKSVLIVTPLIAVTLQIAEEVGIAHYLSYGEAPEQKKSIFREAFHLAVCYQSLKLYDEMGIIPKFDIVIVDEASQVFRSWNDPTQFSESINMLFNILDKSKNAIILDADIDDELCLWGLSRIANFSAETSALYYNSASYLKGYEIAIEDNYGRTLEKLVNSVNSGQRVAVFTSYGDDCGTLSALGSFITEKTKKKVKAFDSNTVTRTAPELKTHPNMTISTWIKENELDCLLVSSWAACGWDYRVKGFDFDEVFVLSTGAFFSAQKIKQMLRRMRMTRKASVYLNNREDAAFKNQTFNAIQSEKGIYESEMTRNDAWQVKAYQAHKMDLVNVPWLLEELLKEGGAIVDKVESTEAELEAGSVILDEWKKHKKEAEKSFKDRNNSSREQMQQIISNFKEVAPHAFLGIDIDDITNAQYQALVNRNKNIDSKKAQRLCRLWSMDEEEAKLEDEHHILQFNVLQARLFHALWFEMQAFVDCPSYISFAHWMTDPSSKEIYGDFKTLNTGSLKLTRSNLEALKKDFANIPANALTEPNRILRPLFEGFDLTFVSKTEMDKEAKEDRISAKEAEKSLVAHYKETKEPFFPAKGKVTRRKMWCLNNIKGKQHAHKNLSEHERIFLMTRPKSFVIRKKKFVSDVWLKEMTKARQVLDDKSGLEENHTAYCLCLHCKVRRDARFAQ